MKQSPRLFNCQKCHAQVVICSHCDRGHIYCGKECASLARIESCRAAEKRYQLSFQGRIKHALRQKRYRMRLKEKVTDHASTVPTQNVLLHSVKNKAMKVAMSGNFGEMRCDFCASSVSSLLRNGFLRTSTIRASLKKLYLRPP
jgi:hypothetical protein